MAKITLGNVAAGLQIIQKYSPYSGVTFADGKMRIEEAWLADAKMTALEKTRMATFGFSVELGTPPGVPATDTKGQAVKPVPVAWILG